MPSHSSWSRRTIALLAALAAVASAQTSPGTRPFRLGFTPFPPVYEDYGYQISYAFLKDHGDLVSLSFQDGIPWVEAAQSSDVTTYPQAVQDTWAATAQRNAKYIPNHSIYLSINTINLDFQGLAPYWGKTINMPRPPPWDTYDFDNPLVEKAVLNYSIAAIRYFHPRYFAVAVEANILLARAPSRWVAFKNMNEYVYHELKRVFPDLPIFCTIQYEHMLGRLSWSADLASAFHWIYPNILEAEVRDLLRNSDMLALSTYPYTAYSYTVDSSYYDTALHISSDLGIPIGVEQTGYISKSMYIDTAGVVLYGSEDAQQSFIKFLLGVAGQNNFRFVVNYVPLDYGYNYGTSNLSMAWAWTGLVNADGTPKQVLQSWDLYVQQPFLEPPAPGR